MWNIKHTMLNGSSVKAGSDGGAEWFNQGMDNPIFGPADMVEVKNATSQTKVSVTINQGRISVEFIDCLTDLRVAGIVVNGHTVQSIEFGD